MQYRVKACDAEGRDQVFVVEADDEQAAAAAIRKRGCFPFHVKRQNAGVTGQADESIDVLVAFVTNKIKAHPKPLGVAAFVLLVAVTAYALTAEGRSYRRAVRAYRAGQFEEALNIVSSLSAEYQARPSTTYLKSDALLRLAQQEIASAAYDAALAHLESVPDTFQKHDTVAQLIQDTSGEIDRLKAEQQAERERRAASVATRSRSSGSNIPEGFVWTGDREADQRRLKFVRELQSGNVRTFDDLERAVRRHSTPSEIREMEEEIRRQNDAFNRAVPDPNCPGAWIWPDD